MTESQLGFQPGVPYRVRRVLGPWINRLATCLGQPSCSVRPAEYAGTVDCPITDLEAKLQADGFSWAPFSLYHRTPAGTRPNGSWTYRSSILADRQLHVILFARDSDTIDIYAHIEPNWLRHPVKHLQQSGIDREEGATQMRKWLEKCGIDANHRSRVTRKFTHLLEQVGDSFARRETRSSQ